jgi:hypothetical protein
MRRFVIASLGALLAVAGVGEPRLASAHYGSSVCPGGTAPWTGTQLTPRAPVELTSEQQLTCPMPQATLNGGSTMHRIASSRGWQNGRPCSQREESFVSIGPVTPGAFSGSTVSGVAAPGHRTASWYDPSASPPGTTSEEIPDGPAAFTSGVDVVVNDNLWNASRNMGSAEMYVTYIRNGTYAGGVCDGTWHTRDQPLCNAVGCYPHTDLVPRAPLPFMPPPPATLDKLVKQVSAAFQQTYAGGHVVSQWASGGYIPQDGEIVRNPVCFWVEGSDVPAAKRFSMVVPQPGSGPVLVVNYVVSAVTDDVWWDYGDGTSEELPGPTPDSPCAAHHAYYHVSADAYGSNHRHTPPPGIAWPFGDSEPEHDMEAVAVWRHMHLGVTAYFQQTNGDSVAVPLPVANQADFWLASQPEWVVVFQIEPWVHMCPPCSTPSPGMSEAG